MNTTNMPVRGSIQSDVPVNPVCPKEPIGSSSPRLEENDESRSHPSVRTFRSPGPLTGVVILATVRGERMRRLPCIPPLSSIRA
jgi:hypothetical protein